MFKMFKKRKGAPAEAPGAATKRKFDLDSLYGHKVRIVCDDGVPIEGILDRGAEPEDFWEKLNLPESLMVLCDGDVVTHVMLDAVTSIEKLS